MEKQNIARYLGESSDYGQIITVGNNVFVVWRKSPQFSYPPKYEIFIKTSRDNGTTFGDGVNLSNNNGSFIGPQHRYIPGQKNCLCCMEDTSNDNSEISLVRLKI